MFIALQLATSAATCSLTSGSTAARQTTVARAFVDHVSRLDIGSAKLSIAPGAMVEDHTTDQSRSASIVDTLSSLDQQSGPRDHLKVVDILEGDDGTVAARVEERSASTGQFSHSVWLFSVVGNCITKIVRY
ncbi:hypothetical protein ACSBM8_00260 [Sphingomonas sp. ASY06-1R]|uniref:hypothetical protein n=1 Tax=Sphingomonas sp. ASY06-1R TaxID=3445771 RepID=UPI003FA22923